MKVAVPSAQHSPIFGQGKYIEGTAAKNARLNLFPRFARYSSKQATIATKAYLNLAKESGLSLTSMALAFVNGRPFVTSNIIGATTVEQLKENIDSVNLELTDEVLDDINKIHENNPSPAP